MIRFLQTPGPVKKVILGGLLTIICVFMVITLVPGFGSSNFFGTSEPQRGIVATVAGDDITSLEVQKEAKQMVARQFPKGGAQPRCCCHFSPRRRPRTSFNGMPLSRKPDTWVCAPP